jgi:hypothetical protein
MKASIEEKIKDYAHSLGIEVVGLAGPERLKDGAPSLDPTYTLKGAKSIVSIVMPMNTEAIYDYLSKKTPVPHHIDQIKMNQEINKNSYLIAAFIRGLGYKASPVPANNSYRRSPWIFAVLPSFSHRFGAMAAGIGAQGWSGNFMTEEYGGATYLGTVVTEAVLKSDPLKYSPRHFVDNYCNKCRVCNKTCLLRMFNDAEEEYVYLNGMLHPRGKRRDINLCNTSCFGLHSISNDKKWSTWGYRWTKAWMDRPLETLTKLKVMPRLGYEASMAGDSGARYKMIRNVARSVFPQEHFEEWVAKDPENLPVEERHKAWIEFGEKCGIKGLKNDTLLTCANCGLVCGPTVEESLNRYRVLTNSGIVIRDKTGDMVNVSDYDEAVRKRKMPKKTLWETLYGIWDLNWTFHKWYFGFEPKSFIQGIMYKSRAKNAIKNRIEGHKDYVSGGGGTKVVSPKAVETT